MSEILDSHHHPGNLALPLSVSRTLDRPDPWTTWDDAEYQARLAMMAETGVDTAVLMPVNRYIMADGVADTRRMNNAVAAYRDRDPARFVAAFGIAEPLHGMASLAEIKRIRAELGFVGVSYHARWQSVATNDPWILRQIELLAELRMIPIVHAHAESNLETPSMVGQVAREFPDVPILVTDGMSSRTNTMHFLDVAQRCDNLYLETSLLYTTAAIRDLVAELGADRIVFGSDTYSYRTLTRNTPDAIRALGLPADQENQILGGNMHRLLASASA